MRWKADSLAAFVCQPRKPATYIEPSAWKRARIAEEPSLTGSFTTPPCRVSPVVAFSTREIDDWP